MLETDLSQLYEFHVLILLDSSTCDGRHGWRAAGMKNRSRCSQGLMFHRAAVNHDSDMESQKTEG